MILLINASNLRKGGGIQVALSFIQECIQFNENEYHVLLSPNISFQINQKEYPENFHFYLIMKSPSSLRFAIGAIHQLKKLEKEIKPDCVFTVFGPSYWTPGSPHLLGFAKGKYLFTDSLFFKKIGSYSKMKIFFAKKIHRYLFKKNSDFFYIESEDAKIRLSSFLGINKKDIFVVSNTHHSIYNAPINGEILLPVKNNMEFRLVTISSYYVHKNLEVIKAVIPFLREIRTKQFTFVLTIEHKIFQVKFKGFEKNIINIGPVPIEMCPELYHECDALFLPTLVEIFTSSYPEAMKMRKPIITSDLSFAHDICGEAAEYFDPLNPEDIAKKIIMLSNDIERQKDLIKKGEERLRNIETSRGRAKKFLEVCYKISHE